MRVDLGRKRIVVTRKGKAVAAIVPIKDLEGHKDVTEVKNILFDPESEFIPWEKAKKELSK